MFVVPKGALLLKGAVTEFRTCLRRIGWNGPSPPESGHFPTVDAVPRVEPKNRMLARLSVLIRRFRSMPLIRWEFGPLPELPSGVHQFRLFPGTGAFTPETMS